jgi:hypothetical protein
MVAMDDWDEWDDPGFDDDLDLDLDEAGHGSGGWEDDDEDDDLDEHDEHDDGLGALEDEDEDEDEELDWGGGGVIPAAGGGLARPPAEETTEGGRRMSAWDFGTATAVAGWLLDRQADRIVDAVREGARRSAGAQDPGTSLPPVEPWQRLAAPTPDATAPPLAVGDALEAARLQRTLDGWLAAGADHVLEARDERADHLLAVLVSPLVPERPVWVVAEEVPGGFSGTRLLPLFTDGGSGRWVCAVDGAGPAVAVAQWALERHDRTLGDLRRTR